MRGPSSNGTTKVGALVFASLTLVSCGDPTEGASGEPPVIVEAIDDSEISRLQLSDSAATRLDIQLGTVEQAETGLVVPSAAIIIDPTGTYWVYTSPEPLVFIRHELEEVYEASQQAFFESGPPEGTPVVVIGVPELYGAEFGIGK
ncbi:MAG: hypothetical protein HKN93_05520 [Acidimicrobiia bacterium]|nr:hypothetical protein [Acidimicrobiia bacterium]